MSRLDSGSVPAQRRALRVQECFDVLQSEFAPSAQAKGLRLRFVRKQLAMLHKLWDERASVDAWRPPPRAAE